MKVTLRQNKLKNKTISLYLDYYPPVVNPKSGKTTRREFLGLYLYEKPKSEEERELNRSAKIAAEQIRVERQLALQNGTYGKKDLSGEDFIEYFESVASNSAANYNSVLRHLKLFTETKGIKRIAFGDVTVRFLNSFIAYLKNDAVSFNHFKKGTTKVAEGTVVRYVDVFKAVLNRAESEDYIDPRIVKKVDKVSDVESRKEFLTLEEVRKLMETPCLSDLTRRASLFSVLTGLRFSDISTITWNQVRKTNNGGHALDFRQFKTGEVEFMPISDQAFELMGKRGSGLVFPGMNKHTVRDQVIRWVRAAGIDKKITFHGFRHTFATLQLTLGTDIYTLSKMMGHRDLKTTEVYAKIVDTKKEEAANRIKL